MANGDPLEPLLHGHPLTTATVDPLGVDLGVDLAALAAGIGHAFSRPELATEALCHRSILDRRPELRAAYPNGNERLEFLGDRVLSLAMADLLLQRFPGEREGDLARRHASLVQAATLLEIAEAVGLSKHLLLGESERQAGPAKPTILADAMEALLGAIFLDAGFDKAKSCIEILWGERLSSAHAAPRDAKTTLQEWAQARRLALPSYREVGREGPPHAPLFVVEVSVKGREPVQGRGASKREAERQAAAVMLQQIEAS